MIIAAMMLCIVMIVLGTFVAITGAFASPTLTGKLLVTTGGILAIYIGQHWFRIFNRKW